MNSPVAEIACARLLGPIVGFNEGALMWQWFRDLPGWAQVVGWLLLSPIIVSMWIWSHTEWPTKWRFSGIVGVAFIAIVIASGSSKSQPPASAPPTPSAPVVPVQTNTVAHAHPKPHPKSASTQAAADQKHLAALRTDFAANFGQPGSTPTWYVPPRDLKLSDGQLTVSSGWAPYALESRGTALELCQALRYNYWGSSNGYGVQQITVYARDDSTILALLTMWDGKCAKG